MSPPGCHWLYMCISCRSTDFGVSLCERWMYNVLRGFIHIFVFLNLKEGKSRWRMLGYFCLVLLQNAAMLYIFHLTKDVPQDVMISLCAVVFGGFVLGNLVLGVSYIYTTFV